MNDPAFFGDVHAPYGHIPPATGVNQPIALEPGEEKPVKGSDAFEVLPPRIPTVHQHILRLKASLLGFHKHGPKVLVLAYSFGAKIGIIRPEHAVVVTTERVGNDAKEHFVRARMVGRQRERHLNVGFLEQFAGMFTGEKVVAGEITYSEGLDFLAESVQGSSCLDLQGRRC